MGDLQGSPATATGPSGNVAEDARRRLHDLLWRRIRAGDVAAAKTRAKELRSFLAALTPDVARDLSKMVAKGGDLHDDLEARLTAELSKEVVERLAKRAAEPADSPVAQRGFLSSLLTLDRGIADPALTPVPGVVAATASGVPATGPGTRPSGSVTKKWEFEGRSIRLKTFKFARIYASVSGTLSVTLSTEGEPGAHHLSFIKKGSGEVEVQVTEALFGATVGAGTKQTKTGSRTLSLTVGTGLFDLELSADLFSPIGVSIPLVNVIDIKLEESFPSLGLKGTGSLVAAIELEIVPDYKNLTEAARAAQNSLRKGGKRFGRAVAKLGGKLGRAIRSGLRELWSLRQLPGGLNTARKILALSKTAKPMRLSPTNISRLAARATIVLEVIFMFKEMVDDLSEAVGALMRDAAEHYVIDAYRWGYATMLDILTHGEWNDSFHSYLSARDQFLELWKARPPMIDISGVGFPDLSDRHREWFMSHATSTEKRKVNLAEMDLEREVPELVGVAVVALYTLSALHAVKAIANHPLLDPIGQLIGPPVEDPPEFTADVARWQRILEIVENEATLAGRATALQDVFAFIVTTSQQGLGNDDREGGESAWDEVAALHRVVFGSDESGTTRAVAYAPLIGMEGNQIFPFAE